MSGKPIYIDKEMIEHPAFRTLNGSAKTVLLDFLKKRQMHKLKGNGRRKAEWIIKNNGDIVYTYAEAEAKGIPRATFMRAIDTLVERGFLYVAHSGNGGLKGDKSLYGIDDRWRKWGTPEFEPATRPKDTRLNGRGFTKEYWKKKKARGNISVKNDNEAVIKNDNPSDPRK